MALKAQEQARSLQLAEHDVSQVMAAAAAAAAKVVVEGKEADDEEVEEAAAAKQLLVVAAVAAVVLRTRVYYSFEGHPSLRSFLFFYLVVAFVCA
uniref:Uncharacterized protein n=1 Tax=Trichogramma kaykai TaxID=54128 RepID=A0ABD2XIE4_9HYME